MSRAVLVDHRTSAVTDVVDGMSAELDPIGVTGLRASEVLALTARHPLEAEGAGLHVAERARQARHLEAGLVVFGGRFVTDRRSRSCVSSDPMHPRWLVAAVLAFACHRAPTAPSSSAPSPPATPSRTKQRAGGEAAAVHLAALEPDTSVAFEAIPIARSHDALMAVNGTPTGERMPSHPPPAYRTAPGRFLVEDHGRNRLLLWDRGARVLTDLGRGRSVVVSRQGRIVFALDERGEHGRWLELDDDGNALRELWVPPADVRTQLVGAHHGAPLVVGIRWPGGGAQPQERVVFVRLLGAGRTESIEHDVDPSWHPASGDAVRGERVLLVGSRREGGSDSAVGADVAVLDLADGSVRVLGRATGAWSMGTAMPHPYVRVEWSDHDPHVHHGFPVEDCTTIVDVTRESIAIRGCD